MVGEIGYLSLYSHWVAANQGKITCLWHREVLRTLVMDDMSGYSDRLINHSVLAVRLVFEFIRVCDQFGIASYLVEIVPEWINYNDARYLTRLDIDIEGLLTVVCRKSSLCVIIGNFNRDTNRDGINTN